jgi:hypothetical protein
MQNALTVRKARNGERVGGDAERGRHDVFDIELVKGRHSLGYAAQLLLTGLGTWHVYDEGRR